MGLRHPSVVPYAAFKTKDGEQIVISIQNNREWVVFATHILLRPDLAEDPRFENNISRVANRTHLEDEISKFFRIKTSKEMYENLKSFGIALSLIHI